MGKYISEVKPVGDRMNNLPALRAQDCKEYMLLLENLVRVNRCLPDFYDNLPIPLLGNANYFHPCYHNTDCSAWEDCRDEL
jgi:hypothetical protein